MFVKDVFPTTPLLAYFEFFYAADGRRRRLRSRVPAPRPTTRCACACATRSHLSALNACDAGFTPDALAARAAAARVPGRMAVVHEGVDTDARRGPTRPRASSWQGRVLRRPASRSSPTSRATSSRTAASTSSCARCRRCWRPSRTRRCWSSAATRSATARRRRTRRLARRADGRARASRHAGRRDARALRRQAAHADVREGAAGLGGARVPDRAVRAVVVDAGGDVRRLPGRSRAARRR